MMPGYQHTSRQPFAGRSDNTMHGGYLQKKQPVYIKPVDSVRSLNEIALRDAEELQVMLKRQAQQPIQNSYPPMENQSYYPIPQGSYAPQATTQGSFGSMAHPGAMPNSYSVPPLQQQPNSYSMLHQHGYHQENFYPGQQEYGHKQERSFSLHTAPMPAVNEGEYQELYETPLNKQAQHIPFHGVPSVKMAPDLPVPDTVGPYGRNFAQDALEQTAFQGDYSYDEPTIPITKERATFQRTAPPPPTWNAAPAPMHMSLSAGGELCDYVPTQTARQKPPLAAVAPAPPLVPPSPAKKDEDITISFKPKVMLVKGNTVSQVRLVLADFEGPDADYIKLDSTPHRAFIGAYWTSKTKELALILGDDVPAHTPVTIVIPASSGVRRVMKKESPVKESSVKEEPVKEETLTTTQASQKDPSRKLADIVKTSELSSPLPVAAKDASVQALAKELNAPAQVPMTETAECPVPQPEPEREKQYGIDIEIEWSEEQDAHVVKEIVRGGAAWKNGLVNVGNVVTHIDEEPLAGKTAEAVSLLMLGKPLTPVVLTVSDLVDPLSGQVQTRDIKVMRYDTVEMTIDFYDEEQFCDIPEVQEESQEVVSQAEWARRQLAQGPKEVAKMVDLNDISKKVSDQTKAAKDRLQNRSQVTKTAYDAEAVSQQARWAKDQLVNRKENTQKTLFDAEMVGEQTRAAMESLANLPQKEVEKKFDATSVAEQAKWAKQQLENRPDNTHATSVDTTSVSEQAQWAKKRLLAKEKGEEVGEDYTLQQNTAVAAVASVETSEPSHAEGEPHAAPADDGVNDGVNTLDALCRLAGIDDLPGMDEVLGTKSPDKTPIAEAPTAPAPAPPAAPVVAASPVAAAAHPAQAKAADSEAEKKRRAMQKRLEFLAKAEAKASANSSANTAAQPAQAEEPAKQQPTNDIVLAPSPVESESSGPSPTAKQPAPSSLFKEPAAPPAPDAPARTASKPLQPVMSPCQSDGPADLNGSSLPPPTKNFVNISRRESEVNVEEQMQFLDALTQSSGNA